MPASRKEVKKGTSMELQDYKYHTCPYDAEDAILLVDAETETVAVTDEDGNMQYYCTQGQHLFVVDDDDALI